MAETPVTKPIRTSIKIAARVAQVARLIELLPTPQDVATKLAGDIIYMASLIQQFTRDINKVLEGYSNIPWDYLNTQLNSLMTSANFVMDKATAYTNYMVDNTLGLAATSLNIGSELYETTMDVVTHTAQTASSFGAAIASTSADIKGDHDTAQAIRDGVQQWNPTDGDNPLKTAAGKIVDAQNKVNDWMGDATDAVNDAGAFLKSMIDKLKGMVEKMSKDVDEAFGGIVQTDKISTTLTTVSDGLTGYNKALASQVVGASAEAINSIISNFSLGKFVSAFLGVATSSVLITTGLNELPPINIDKMLSEFQGSLANPLKGVASDVTFDDLVQYDPQKYNDLRDSFETYLLQQRTEIFSKKKNIFTKNTAEAKAYIKASKAWYNGMTKEQRQEIKTAIKEIKKKRDSAKNAKVAKKLKDVVLEELKKLQEACKVFAKRLKEEWEAMLQTYKDAVKQIKEFFENGGPGDQYVEDLCLDINDNCDNIKQLCMVDMPTQIAGSGTKAVLPYCFGMAVPNYAHNAISFIVDLKIILKFVMDLIKYIMNILDDIKKLAQLFLNALKKLRDMINQLLDMLGLGWFMDLVQDLVDAFQEQANETTKMLEGTLTPVYLKDTSLYYKWVDEINAFRNKITSSSDDLGDWEVHVKNSHINGLLVMMGAEPIDYEKGNTSEGYPYLATQQSGGILDGFTGITSPLIFTPQKRPLTGVDSNGNTASGNVWKYDRKEISKRLGELLDYIKSTKDTYIVAYRSPKFKSYDGDNALTKDQYVIEGSFEVNMERDPSQVETWYYYHPNLNHLGYDIEFYNLKGKTFNYKDFPFAGMVGSDTSHNREYYTEYMSNAARNPNNNWQHKTIKKLGTNYGTWGDAFNIVCNNTITASEAYYWYQDVIEDDADWTRILLPNGDYDTYYDPDDENLDTYLDPDKNVDQPIGFEVKIDEDDNVPVVDMFYNGYDPIPEDGKLSVSFTIDGIEWGEGTPYVHIWDKYYPINTGDGVTNVIVPFEGSDEDPFKDINMSFDLTPETVKSPLNDEGDVDFDKINLNICDLSIVDGSIKPTSYGMDYTRNDDDFDVNFYNNGGLPIDSDTDMSITLDVGDIGDCSIIFGGEEYKPKPNTPLTLIGKPIITGGELIPIKFIGDEDDIKKIEVLDMSILDGYDNFNVKIDIDDTTENNISGKVKFNINGGEYTKTFGEDHTKKVSLNHSWGIGKIETDMFDILITGVRPNISNTTNITTKWQLNNATYNGDMFGSTNGCILKLDGCVVLDKSKPVDVVVTMSFDDKSGIANIINQSEKGSVVKIKIDGEEKLIWVKNKTLQRGDFVSVKIDDKIKYFQVF